MAMEHVEYVYTAGMTEGEVERRLRESHAGVLALASGGDAYAVPVSHHFDDGRLLFRLSRSGEDRKLAFLEDTRTATFVLYDVAGPGDAWSIVARGPVGPAPADDAETFNELFEPIHIFDESVDDLELAACEMRIESLSGRRTVA